MTRSIQVLNWTVVVGTNLGHHSREDYAVLAFGIEPFDTTPDKLGIREALSQPLYALRPVRGLSNPVYGRPREKISPILRA